MLRSRAALMFVALVFAVLALAACGSKEPPVIDIGATDYAFQVPEEVSGGVVRLKLTNSGQEAHHAQLVRLNDGVSFEQFQETLSGALSTGNLGPVFGAVTFEGGPSGIEPGGSSEAVLNLQEGNYALLCFIESPSDGVPHLAKGMVKSFKVAGDSGAEAPEFTADVKLNDFAFTGAPTEVSAGTVTWKVTNAGKEPHEMTLLKLRGVTANEFPAAVQAMFSGQAPEGPPPFVDAGGFQAIMPGDEGYATMDLTAGDYALICFVPSPANQGAPHAALGMIQTFSVN